MKKLPLVAILLVACAAGSARTTTSKSGSLCDILPAPTCKDTLPPVKPWDGNALPQPQTDRGFILIHPDPKNPGSMIAATTDDGNVISLISLPIGELAKLLMMVFSEDDQKTDAGRKLKVPGKVEIRDVVRVPSAELYRQVSVIELEALRVASEQAAQCDK